MLDSASKTDLQCLQLENTSDNIHSPLALPAGGAAMHFVLLAGPPVNAYTPRLVVNATIA